jgi:oligosaccharide translocation protein RFT1
MSNDVLKKSLRGAGLNVAVSVLVRVFTFAANGFILRFVARDVLGLINVRLLLLFDTVLFLSREAFRKSCLRKPEDGNWRGEIRSFARHFENYLMNKS